MGDVLVLNRDFLAIHVCSWKDAMCLLYKEHAHVVDEDYRKYTFDEWKELSQMIEESPSGFINTPSFRLAVPEVIALAYYDRLPDTNVKFTRKNIYNHYHCKCCYCGNKFNTKDLTLDHVIPKSRGGKTSWDNIVLSCVPCNSRKDSRTPIEAGMQMKYKATKPSWRRSFYIQVGSPMRVKTSWQKFIDFVYWNSELESE